MSLFVLDTDTLSLQQHGHAVLAQRIASHPPSELAITVITVEEQIAGRFALLRRAADHAQLAQASAGLARTVSLLSNWPILVFTEPAIQRFEQLQRMRLNVGSYDLRIAAIVLENNATLVTRNLRDFRRVPGLVCEDWSV